MQTVSRVYDTYAQARNAVDRRRGRRRARREVSLVANKYVSEEYADVDEVSAPANGRRHRRRGRRRRRPAGRPRPAGHSRPRPVVAAGWLAATAVGAAAGAATGGLVGALVGAGVVPMAMPHVYSNPCAAAAPW